MTWIWKTFDNGEFTVATDCTTPEEFVGDVEGVLLDYINKALWVEKEDGEYKCNHDFAHSMPQIIENVFGIYRRLCGLDDRITSYDCSHVKKEQFLYRGGGMLRPDDEMMMMTSHGERNKNE